MTKYEIRILKSSVKSIILESTLANDFAAVRRAQAAMSDGDLVEIWRGMTCIYSTNESANRTVV